MHLSRNIKSLVPSVLRKAYSKNRWFLGRYWFFIRRFRNFPQLITSWRGQYPCLGATQWDGRRLYHPPGCRGLADGLIELWFEDVYRVKELTLPTGAVVVDIGANIGLFSIQVALQTPNCRVVAIEPVPECFECIKASVRSFSLTNVEAHQLGLGRAKGLARVRRAGRSLDNRLTCLAEGTNGEAPITVLSMDELFARLQLEDVELLKMDIEGGEYDVFSTVRSSTLLQIRTIVAEFHDNICAGTLQLLRNRLSETHDLEIIFQKEAGNGLLIGRRKAGQKPETG
jgi:FkbM family methyltransferase